MPVPVPVPLHVPELLPKEALVPEERVELTCLKGPRVLSALRIPFRHSGRRVPKNQGARELRYCIGESNPSFLAENQVSYR